MSRLNLVLFSVLAAGLLGIGIWFVSDPRTGAALEQPYGVTAANVSGMRMVSEARLIIPPEMKEAVWQYLVGHLVDDKTWIKSLDPGLNSYWFDEMVTDVYFDTPDLILYHNRNSLRFRTRANLTNPDALPGGQRLVQVSIHGSEPDNAGSSIQKFEVKISTKKPRVPDDLPAPLRWIKSNQRDGFKASMQQLSVNPYALKPVLTLKQEMRSIYIPRNGENFICIRLSTDTSRLLWVDFNQVVIEPQMDDAAYAAASAEEQQEMERIYEALVHDIANKFPAVSIELTPKYHAVFDDYFQQIPRLDFLEEYIFDN